VGSTDRLEGLHVEVPFLGVLRHTHLRRLCLVSGDVRSQTADYQAWILCVVFVTKGRTHQTGCGLPAGMPRDCSANRVTQRTLISGHSYPPVWYHQSTTQLVNSEDVHPQGLGPATKAETRLNALVSAHRLAHRAGSVQRSDCARQGSWWKLTTLFPHQQLDLTGNANPVRAAN
jgi:hypothetical protein